MSCVETVEESIEDVNLEACENLRVAASIASFRTRHIECFRQELSQAIKRVLFLSQKESAREFRFISYDAPRLEKCFSKVDWKGLCEFHDSQVERKIESTTPLQEITAIIQDPTVIPRSCCNSVTNLLILALLQSPRQSSHDKTRGILSVSRWSPAQLLLLKCITFLWRSCPSINTFVIESLTSSIGSDTSPNKWNRLLSAVNHLVKDCPHLQFTLTSFAVTILRELDHMDMKLIKSSNKKRPNSKRGDICAHCQGMDVSLAPTRKRAKIASLFHLHDEDITTSHSQMSKVYRSKYLPQQKEISLKTILRSSQKLSTAKFCSCTHDSTEETSNFSSDWALVRSRGYKKFMSLFHHHPTSGLAWECRGFPLKISRSRQPRRFDQDHLLQLAYQHFDSPCIRVCLLLVASSRGKEFSTYYRRTVKSCWTRFLRSRDPLWLRIYSEFLVEFAFFDQREESWDVFRPLMRYFTNDQKSTESDLTQDVFSCALFVLSRRCRIFQVQQDDIQNEFNECLTNISLRYGEAKYWINDKLDVEERSRYLQVLQRLGILGLSELADFTIFGDAMDTKEECCEITKDSIVAPPRIPLLQISNVGRSLNRTTCALHTCVWDEMLPTHQKSGPLCCLLATMTKKFKKARQRKRNHHRK